jgi:hypothetical protein
MFIHPFGNGASLSAYPDHDDAFHAFSFTAELGVNAIRLRVQIPPDSLSVLNGFDYHQIALIAGRGCAAVDRDRYRSQPPHKGSENLLQQLF